MGGRGNCAELLSAAETTAREARWAPFLLPFTNPWYFRGPEDYEALLPRSCFRPLRAELVHKEMVHESRDELRAWLRTTWMPVLSRVPEALRRELADAIVDCYLAVRPPDARGRTHATMVPSLPVVPAGELTGGPVWERGLGTGDLEGAMRMAARTQGGGMAGVVDRDARDPRLGGATGGSRRRLRCGCRSRVE
jgi:hypothetical protein